MDYQELIEIARRLKEIATKNDATIQIHASSSQYVTSVINIYDVSTVKLQEQEIVTETVMETEGVSVFRIHWEDKK